MSDARLLELSSLVTRSSRVTAVATLFGALLMLGAFVYLSKTVYELDQRRQSLKSENAALLKQVETNQARANASAAVIGSARLKLAAGDTSAAASVLSSTQVAASSGQPVVYFQTRSIDQQPLYDACRQRLTTAGYVVPAQETVSIGPNNTSVRYFHQGEYIPARNLATALAACVTGPISITLISSSTIQIPAQQFEVWFAPNLR